MHDFDANNEEFKSLIKNIELKLKNKDSFYLDVEEIGNVCNYYLEKGIVNKALVILKIGLNLHPVSSEIRLHMAQVYLAQGEYKTALTFANKTLEIEPNNTEVLILKAEIFSYQGNHKKSVEFYLEYLERNDSENLDLIYNDIAWEFESLKDYANALKYLKLALALNPKEDTLLFEIAYFYEEMGKQEECIAFYNKFLDENPYSYNGWYNLGIVYNERKQFKKAVFAFEYATLIKEDFASAYFNKGNAHYNLKEYGLALECYYNTFEYEDNQAITFCYIGECYEKLENYPEAEKSYEIALTLSENIQEALVGMAIIKDKMGKTIESVPFIEKANKLYPKNPDCWYIAGEVYNRLERYEDAYYSYSRADEFNDEKNIQIILDFSNFIAENLSLQEAVDYLKNSKKTKAKFRLVAYLQMLGKHKKAMNLLEKCLAEKYDGHKDLLEYYPEMMEMPEYISLIENFRA
ncbi:MAG: tetratricopeptide repeat protein [Flavobacteriales bacterium]